MKNRAYEIDVLRGLAIIGMALSGQILRHADLPAWLFHAQVPPPNFVFDPSVAGITWVDLVFPFFLFAMGAAFPLAMRKRLDTGIPAAKPVPGIIRRWALLSFFAIALANMRFSGIPDLPGWGAALLQIVGWGCFCAMFMRFERLSANANRIVCFTGIATAVALMAAARLIWHAPVSVYRSDIIILILANMALFGSLTWLFTRNNVRARLAILVLLVALRTGAGVEGSWTQALWDMTPVPWLFRFDYLKYLCIIIPGTIAGDAIFAAMQRTPGKETEKPNRPVSIGILILTAAIFVTNMWGLFTRHLVWNIVLTLVFGFAAMYMLRKERSNRHDLYVSLFGWGFFWLVTGLLLEPFEGGIKKDHATFSYFFVTSGLASMTVMMAGMAMRQFKMRFNWLIECGQNPMVAYTAAGFLIMPALRLLHLSPLLSFFAEIGPWGGVLHGMVITAAVVAVTVFFTRKRLFWRT